jgi:1-acyl-sn-glycerol-3-phosphate acyltransferase
MVDARASGPPEAPPLADRIRVGARKALRIGGFAGITAALIPLYVTRDRLTGDADRVAVRDRWLQRWSGSLLRLFAVRVDVRGAASAGSATSTSAAARGRLVVSNHRSALDVGVLLQHFGGHMVSRADLSGWPIVGAAARSVGTVFVDRSSTTSGASTIRAVRALLRAGETVIVFPEGTTFEGDTVRPFQPGAFLGALNVDALVVPVGLAYETGSGAAFVGESFTRHLARMAGSGPTRVVVRVGDPIAVTSNVRAGDVARRAQDVVQALVAQARVDVDAR